MYCLPQENPCILAYIAFMLAVRNMILKHDFLAHITCYFSKSATLSSSLQQLLHGAESQGAQLELLYYLQSHLPPCLCLPWLFPVLDLSSLYIVGSFRSQKPLTNNSSRSPFFPPSLQHSTLNDSGHILIRPLLVVVVVSMSSRLRQSTLTLLLEVMSVTTMHSSLLTMLIV